MNLSELYVDLDPDFNRSFDNDVAAARGDRAIKNSIIGIIMTPKGTRPFDPDFGCDLAGSLFENMNPLTNEVIKQSIYFAIRNYEPRINNISIDTITDYDGNKIIVKMTYSIITDPQKLEKLTISLSP